MEEWRTLTEFPGYSVSDCGRVRNDQTGRYLVLQVNQTGVPNVGLSKRNDAEEPIQHKRSVALLVASTFLTPHEHEQFDTPINLDGNRQNNNVRNLMWRPRWFAVRYFEQFRLRNPRWVVNHPIQDKKSKEVFENSWDAVVKHGLIEQDIYLSMLDRTYVWPTYQVFEAVRSE